MRGNQPLVELDRGRDLGFREAVEPAQMIRNLRFMLDRNRDLIDTARSIHDTWVTATTVADRTVVSAPLLQPGRTVIAEAIEVTDSVCPGRPVSVHELIDLAAPADQEVHAGIVRYVLQKVQRIGAISDVIDGRSRAACAVLVPRTHRW